MINDYYQILNISSSANQEEVKTAYEIKLKESSKTSSKTASKVEEAFKVLSDLKKRKSYDKELLDIILKENAHTLLDIRRKSKFSFNRDLLSKVRIKPETWIEILAILIITLISYSYKTYTVNKARDGVYEAARTAEKILLDCNSETFNELEILTDSFNIEIGLSQSKLVNTLSNIHFTLNNCKKCLDNIEERREQANCTSNLNNHSYYEAMNVKKVITLIEGISTEDNRFNNLLRLYQAFESLSELHDTMKVSRLQMSTLERKVTELEAEFGQFGCIK